MDNPNLSERYKKYVKSIFDRHIKGFCNINHLCISICFPNGELKMLSPWPEAEEDYFNQKVSVHDKCFSPEWYKEWPIYFWRDPNYGTSYQNRIMRLKEDKYGLFNGFYSVNKVNDFYIIYGFAFPTNDPRTYTIAVNNIEKLREAGSFLYEMYYPIFNLYSDDFVIPKLGVTKSFNEILKSYNGEKLSLSDDKMISATRHANNVLLEINNIKHMNMINKPKKDIHRNKNNLILIK